MVGDEIIVAMLCQCGNPGIILLEAQPSQQTMFLCREHVEASLRLPQLSNETKRALRAALARANGGTQ